MGDGALSRWKGARDAMIGGAALMFVLVFVRGVAALVYDRVPVPENLVAWLMAKHQEWEVALAILPWLLACSLAAAIAEGLRERHVPSRIATFAAKAAVAVFTAAYDDWADDTTADFSALMQRSLSALRHAVSCAQPNGNPSQTGTLPQN